MRTAALTLLLVACGAKTENGSGTGTGTGTGTGCEDVRAHVEQLYGGNADDVAMVMKDCAARAEVAGCVKQAKTAAELEQRCLIPLDEEGSEGDGFKVR